MKVNLHNTSALSDGQSGRFMLGKKIWRITGDNSKCHKGKPYETTLKLSGCFEGEFTCEDGQCIKMEKRCNQVPDCRDETDEKKCKLVILKNSYNKDIPPMEGATDAVKSANVNISLTLMKVVEIEETDHSIHLQFQIMLEWRETDRVTYHNLKKEISLNTLSNINELWLPLIIYDNTDQKESTRLAPWNEWTTTVTVTREGEFNRSDLRDVDEIEIFKGSKNKLTMYQTYTKQFQCKYQLHRYPFDTQVGLLNI